MADNTTRPNTTGGDTIRSETEPSGTSAPDFKTQVFKHDGDLLVSGAKAQRLFQGLRDRKAARLEALKEYRRSALTRAGSAPTYTSARPSPRDALTINGVLGSRLYRWLKDYTVGTWTDWCGNGDATQTTPANQPAQTTQGGQTAPDFDGAGGGNEDWVNIGALSALPTYSATDHFIWGCAFRCDASAGSSGGTAFYMPTGGDFYYVLNADGTANVIDCHSNGTVIGIGWTRMIVVKNGSSTVLTMYINGVAQTVTGTGGMGQDWKTNAALIGDRDGTGWMFDGVQASMFWGRDTSPFTAQDVADLDSALVNLLNI